MPHCFRFASITKGMCLCTNVSHKLWLKKYICHLCNFLYNSSMIKPHKHNARCFWISVSKTNFMLITSISSFVFLSLLYLSRISGCASCLQYCNSQVCLVAPIQTCQTYAYGVDNKECKTPDICIYTFQSHSLSISKQPFHGTWEMPCRI